MVQQGKKGNELANGGTKYRDQPAAMTSQRKDTGDARGNGIGKTDGRSQNGTSSFFRTDTAISGNRSQGERVLQRWVPDKPADTDGSLEGGRGKVVWDQFAENERRFGIKTDYDENIYTTQINMNHPQYSQRLAAATRVAREIERSTAINSHVAEERIADHTGSNENGLDEEDKYSGVRRQDFPPLTASKGAYQPPGKRAPVDRTTVDRAPAAAPVAAPAERALVDSAIMFAGAKADKPADKAKSPVAAKPTKPEAATPPTTTESSTTPTPEVKTSAPPPTSTTLSPKVKTTGGPNATATVEADVSKAFKSFAADERNNVQQARLLKAKNDKQIKLNDLKKFADSFKLHTPVPTDLVSIIAKDPAKQREIQEKAIRNAEAAKLNSESTKPIVPNADANPAQRSATTTATTTSPPSGTSSRQNVNRGSFYPPGAHSFTQNSRGDRPVQAQQPIPRSGTSGNLSQRLRTLEQNRAPQMAPNALPAHEARLPPTGPANAVDLNFSRRSSGVASAQGGPRLNANVSEFRPGALNRDLPTAGNPSSDSSPRSMANPAETQPTPPAARSLLHRKPLAKGSRPLLKGNYDAMEYVKSLKPEKGGEWTGNGGLRAAYDTNIVWKTPSNDAPTITYVEVFEKAPFPTTTPAVSEPQPPQTAPQVPHQHQLPFHLQSGVHNINARQSPRQPPINMHGVQMGHPAPAFSGPDELRMMPSHSAQSFSSPRLQQPPMAFHSPMGANAQLAYNPQMLPYPPQGPPFRSLSQNHQFMPQQAHMAQPVMMPNPAGGFMPPHGMGPGPQMIYPPGAQGQFMPPNNGHPPAMPNGGYPSPGRGAAPMMMNQGSQQGHPQPMYGMSPGPQYNVAPMFPQPIPNQMSMGGAYGAPNQFGTSPQMRNQYNHNQSNHNGNRNLQQRGQHPHGPPNNQVPTGPQAQSSGGPDESK